MMWDTCPYVDINSVGAGGTAVNVWSESLLRDEQRHEECTDHRCGEHRTGSDKSNVPGNEIGRGEPHGRPRVKFVKVEEMLEHSGPPGSAGSADE